jgi:tripartite-type tricarboxylate transporter receptor subunit TctC
MADDDEGCGAEHVPGCGENPMKTIRSRAILLAVTVFCCPIGSAAADAVADFYRGKVLEIDVGTGVGGGYDANARLVARHLGRFIPGNPTIVVKNIAGGGGLTAANVLYNVARRDGTVIATFSNSMITEPLLGAGQAKFDPAKFIWLGSASREDGICVAAETSGVRSWSDLLQKELYVGTAAPGTTTYMYPIMLRNMFGAKFKPVFGYPDAGQIALAIERGEVQSVCQTYSSLKVQRAAWLRDGVIHPLIALGLNRIPDFPDLPSVMEFAKETQQQQVLKLILAPTLAGRPFVGPPEVPEDRASALADAFAAMTQDNRFLEEAQRSRMDVEPVSGSQIDTLVKQIYALPADVIVETKRVVTAAER